MRSLVCATWLLAGCGLAATGGGTEPPAIVAVDDAGIEPPPIPSARACPPGALDLAAMTQAEGTSSFSFGPLARTEMTTVLGFPMTPTTGAIALCLPPDAISVMLMSRPSGYVTSLATPEGVELVDPSTRDSFVASPAGVDTLGFHQLLYPATPSQVLMPGMWSARFGLDPAAEDVPLTLTVRRGNEPDRSRIDLNVVVVADGQSQADVDAIFGAAREALRELTPEGIAPGAMGYGVIRDPRLAVITDSSARDAQIGLMAAELAPGATVMPWAPTVYVVRSMMNPAFGVTFGAASGVPGPALVRAGAAVATDSHRLADGRFDLPHLTNTMAHELGHFLGLRHTSEMDGVTHDHLGDTAECLASHDANRDGSLASGECPDGANLMFWEGLTTAQRTMPVTLTHDQAFILRRTPWAHRAQ